MEVSALKYSGGIGLHARSPLLRLQSDERLVALTRRGGTAAFEVLVARYSSRLLAFCRHLLGSREDAEDVLQEIFAASFNAMLVDERPINVRPWLYRIARNRCLNHLRRIQAIGVESMDVHLSDHGASTADKVHEREEFRMLVGDIQDLPETQRTALVLREMDALSYEQIAEAMETTVPSVKSLLVRARVSLAEAAEARLLSCEEVRTELGEVAEGLRRRPSPLVRRHLRACQRCSLFRTQLKETNRALAALLPIGPLALFKQFVLGHLTAHSAGAGSGAAGSSAGAAGTTAAGAAGTTVAGTTAAGSSVLAGSTASGFISAGVGALATKAAAGIAVATLVTAGAVEVSRVAHPRTNTLASTRAELAPATAASVPGPGVSPLPADRELGRRLQDAATRPQARSPEAGQGRRSDLDQGDHHHDDHYGDEHHHDGPVDDDDHDAARTDADPDRPDGPPPAHDHAAAGDDHDGRPADEHRQRCGIPDPADAVLGSDLRPDQWLRDHDGPRRRDTRARSDRRARHRAERHAGDGA